MPTLGVVCGDVTADGRVTAADVIAEALLGWTQDPRYDVNHDGKVDLTDLGIAIHQAQLGAGLPGGGR
jgi:hypothetical protein